MHAEKVESIVGDTAMRDAMEQTTRNLPRETVKKGDKWNAEWELKLPIANIKYKTENRLVGPATRNKRKCVKVTQTGDVTLGEGALIEISNVDWKGTSWIDIATRETVYCETTIKSEMAMTLMGEEVKAHSEVVTRIELLPAKEEAKGGKTGK
jgi:hypothetical protein